MNWKACRHSRCAKRWGLSVCSVDVYVLREYAFCKRELSLKGAVLLPWKRGKNNEKLNLNPQSPNSSLSQSLCSFSRSSNLWLGDFDHTPGYDSWYQIASFGPARSQILLVVPVNRLIRLPIAFEQLV